MTTPEETAFDKVLAEELSSHRDVFFAVRDRAIINDVTAREARSVGIDVLAADALREVEHEGERCYLRPVHRGSTHAEEQ